MNRGTQAVIGATVILLGVGFVALGAFEDEQTVRHVDEVLADPAAHSAGAFTLIGIPQPETLKQQDGPAPNPQRGNETRWLDAWSDGGVVMHSTHTTRVFVEPERSVWHHTNRTQVAGQPNTATWTNSTWTIDGPHTVFFIDGFIDANGETPSLWGVYEGTLRDAVQPKPSQFQGRITTHWEGTVLPDGALLYHVTEFTAGCSSKFLPDEYEA